MRRFALLFALLLNLPSLCFALENGVAVVTAAGASGIQTGTEIRRDLLGECILKLPNETQLTPVSTASDKFLHRIDGTDRDAYTQVWSSSIQLGWQVRQRFLYIVGSKGVGNTAAPQFHQDSAQIFRSEQIDSDPSESTHFSEISPRTRFFASAQEAEVSARKRAAAKLRELQGNLCSDRQH